VKKCSCAMIASVHPSPSNIKICNVLKIKKSEVKIFILKRDFVANAFKNKLVKLLTKSILFDILILKTAKNL